MAQVIIRNLDPAVVAAIKASAALNGRSMEAELREAVEGLFTGRKQARDRKELIQRFRRLREKIGVRGGEDSVKILRKMRDGR